MSTSFPLAKLRVRFAGDTHTGLKRNHNEDCLYLPDEERLIMVADGMGGHASGDVASRLAIDTMANFFRSTVNDTAATWPFLIDHGIRRQRDRLTTSVKLANLEIYQRALQEGRPRGMGTTIVAAFFCDEMLLMAHVGDSRIYRVRNGEIAQMTEDHSLLNDYIKMNRIRPEDAANFPHNNVIVKALGMKESVAIDILEDQYQEGDIYLLCSDGLSGMVKNSMMLHLACNEPDLDKLCEHLIAEANTNGGNDNITVGLARIEGD